MSVPAEKKLGDGIQVEKRLVGVTKISQKISDRFVLMIPISFHEKFALKLSICDK